MEPRIRLGGRPKEDVDLEAAETLLNARYKFKDVAAMLQVSTMTLDASPVSSLVSFSHCTSILGWHVSTQIILKQLELSMEETLHDLRMYYLSFSRSFPL